MTDHCRLCGDPGPTETIIPAPGAEWPVCKPCADTYERTGRSRPKPLPQGKAWKLEDMNERKRAEDDGR